jgi:hypothetical protein
MQNKKIKMFAVLLIGFGPTALQAQEVIPASGSHASGSGGSVNYTIGQVFYKNNTGTNGYSLTGGAQQPFEISVVTGIEQAKNINLEFLVYPNPTSSFIMLKIEGEVRSQISAILYDINGKLLEIKTLNEKTTEIPMTNQIPGIYFLNIRQNNKVIKIFKIIKN